MAKRKIIGIVDDMEHCVVCGSPNIEIHHCIHGTANRALADKYHLVIPLCKAHHTSSRMAAHMNKEVDLQYKQAAQAYFEKKYGTRTEFIKIFGKSWL